MVNFGEPFHVYTPDQAEAFATCSESCAVGLWSHHTIVEWPQEPHFYGVHFKANGAYPFFQLPLSELHNQVVPLDTLWQRFAAEIREQLYAAPSIQAGFALLERFLLTRLGEVSPALKVTCHAIDEIARHHGTLSIRALSDQIGISQNHLNTHFKRMVGIPPKELTRFYRFVHVLRSIDPTQKVDWTQIAHQSCFYDQSHFNKDFAAFTGHTPTEYLQARRRLYAENPHQSQDIGNMPIG
jgi:AraC-like DNA-binding protein